MSVLSSSFSRFLLKSSNPSKPRRHRSALLRASRNGIRSQLDSAGLTSSVGSPPPVGVLRWDVSGRHIAALNVAACAVAISTSWLFFSAIPALLALKRAAESMEKLLDATAQELPDTMAAVRLSGMEISDLTLELSDIGQEITQGVRNSTRVVRLAEGGLRRLTTMAPTVPMQSRAPPRNETEIPALAKAARDLREGIMKGRAVLGVMFSVPRFSRWALNFLAARQQKRSA